jgi:hypothetical protein
MWELHNNVHLLTAANLDTTGEVINLLSIYNLVQVLALNVATLEVSSTRNLTCPDNMFCSADLEHLFTQCSIDHKLCPVVTDHFPIISMIDLTPERTTPAPKHNFRGVDWEEARKVLLAKLEPAPPATEINNHKQFNEAYRQLTITITEMVSKCIPLTKPSLYLKRWWSKELDAEQKELQKLGRKARKRIKRRLYPIHEEYRVACNKFSESIKRTKEEHWKEWLEDLTITSTWNFHKYASSDPGDQVHMRIKTLQDPAVNE